MQHGSLLSYKQLPIGTLQLVFVLKELTKRGRALFPNLMMCSSQDAACRTTV